MEKLFKILYKYQKEGMKLKQDADNPFFKSKYITLDNILKHYIPKFNSDGVLCFHTVQDKELVTSLVLMEGGETITSKFPLNNTDPQKQGSEITYGKRYNLGALLNIQTDEDDDGNKASSGGNTKEFYKGKFDVMDYVTRIRDEDDVNALDSIYKEFIAEKPSQKQKDWIIKECSSRKDTLLDK